jgi:hypothetical protein
MTDAINTPLPTDTRPEQAQRVADFLEKYPASTAKEIDAVCDTGCISKVISDMCSPNGLGYKIEKGWRTVDCAGGGHSRSVRTYTLISRPTKQQQELFVTQ